MKTYDAIVIGSVGVPLATDFAGRAGGWPDRGGPLGGSCINYGCTPTKTMIASARIARLPAWPEFGVHTGKVRVNMAEIVARKNEIVGSFRSGIENQVNDNAQSHPLSRTRPLYRPA